jgi:hypothetical protein
MRNLLTFAILSVLLFFQTSAAQARTFHAPSLPTQAALESRLPLYQVRSHDVGALRLAVTNYGFVGNVSVPDSSAIWRNTSLLSGAGIWIGAIAPDNLPYVSTGLWEYELRGSLDPVDVIYRSVEGAPNGNRIGYSQTPDDDADGYIDEDPLNGKDDDGDGRIDEDYSALSDQMFSCEYWDYTEEAIHAYPEHRPLHVRVHQNSYAYGDGATNEFIGMEYRIKNDGAESLRHVYVGIYMDADIGPLGGTSNYGDDGGDFFSRDTVLTDWSLDPGECRNVQVHVALPYMYDIPDGIGGANGGDAPGFFGFMLLDHTTDPSGEKAPRRVRPRTARFLTGTNAYPAGDPANDFERYDLLSSGSQTARPTGTPNDYRACMSVGPFPVFEPGDEIEFVIVFVAGDGYVDPDGVPHPDLGSNGLPSEHSLLANALRARLVYEGRWVDLDGIPTTGIDGRETCIAQPLHPYVWIDPCDSLHTIQVGAMTCDMDSAWVDMDCNPCTPQPSNEFCAGGCETQAHWYEPSGVTPVIVNGFAAGSESGGIRITWSLQNSADTEGFLLERARLDEDGATITLNAGAPVHADGPYEYLDRDVVPGATYSYWLLVSFVGGDRLRYGPIIETAAAGGLVPRLTLLPPLPNPTPGDLRLKFDVPRPGHVGLDICDLQGRIVKSLVAGSCPAGRNTVSWDGKNSAGRRAGAGLYFVRLRYGSETVSGRLVILR